MNDQTKQLFVTQIQAPITTAANIARSATMDAESEKEEWDIREMERRDFERALSDVHGMVGKALLDELANYLVIPKSAHANDALHEIWDQWPDLLPEMLKAHPLTAEQARVLGVVRVNDLGIDEWTKIEQKHKPEFDPDHGQRMIQITAVRKAIEASLKVKTPGEVVEILKTVLPPGYRIHSKPHNALGRVLNAIRHVLEAAGDAYWAKEDSTQLAEMLQGSLLRGFRGENEMASVEIVPNVWMAFTAATGTLGLEMLGRYGRWRTSDSFGDLIQCMPRLEEMCADWLRVQHPLSKCLRAALHGNLTAYLSPANVSWLTNAERKDFFDGGPAKVILQQGMPGDQIITALEIIGATPFAQAVEQVMKGNAAVEGQWLQINMRAPVDSIIEWLDKHIPTTMNTVRDAATTALVENIGSKITREMTPKEVGDVVRSVHPGLCVVGVHEYGKPGTLNNFLMVDMTKSGDEIIKLVREACPKAAAYLEQLTHANMSAGRLAPPKAQIVFSVNELTDSVVQRFRDEFPEAVKRIEDGVVQKVAAAIVPKGLLFVTTDHPENVAKRFKDEFPEAAKIIERNACAPYYHNMDKRVRLQDHIETFLKGPNLWENIGPEVAEACAGLFVGHANNNGGRLFLVQQPATLDAFMMKFKMMLFGASLLSTTQADTLCELIQSRATYNVRLCTCSGGCKGRAGLACGWTCAMEHVEQQQLEAADSTGSAFTQFLLDHYARLGIDVSEIPLRERQLAFAAWRKAMDLQSVIETSEAAIARLNEKIALQDEAISQRDARIKQLEAGEDSLPLVHEFANLLRHKIQRDGNDKVFAELCERMWDKIQREDFGELQLTQTLFLVSLKGGGPFASTIIAHTDQWKKSINLLDALEFLSPAFRLTNTEYEAICRLLKSRATKQEPPKPPDAAVDGAANNLALIRGVVFLIWELEQRFRKLEEVGVGLLSGMMIHELDLMIEHLMQLYPKKMAMLEKERAGENTQVPGCPDQLVEELSDRLEMRLALTCCEASDLACWAFETGTKAVPQPKQIIQSFLMDELHEEDRKALGATKPALFREIKAILGIGSNHPEPLGLPEVSMATADDIAGKPRPVRANYPGPEKIDRSTKEVRRRDKQYKFLFDGGERFILTPILKGSHFVSLLGSEGANYSVFVESMDKASPDVLFALGRTPDEGESEMDISSIEPCFYSVPPATFGSGKLTDKVPYGLRSLFIDGKGYSIISPNAGTVKVRMAELKRWIGFPQNTQLRAIHAPPNVRLTARSKSSWVPNWCTVQLSAHGPVPHFVTSPPNPSPAKKARKGSRKR